MIKNALPRAELLGQQPLLDLPRTRGLRDVDVGRGVNFQRFLLRDHEVEDRPQFLLH